MSDKSTESNNEEVKAEAELEKTSDNSCSSGASYCKPHTSLYISIIALLLAAYAAIMAGSDTSAVEKQVSELDSRMASVDMQITTLSKEIKENRNNLIQTKLKKALESIQEIGNLAEQETKSAITEIESMLKALTVIDEQLDSAPKTAPASETEVEPVVEPAATEPEPTPAESAPVEQAPIEQTAAEPAAEAAETSAETESAIEEVAPAASSKAPAEAPTAETETTPASEPSAPQAF